MIFYSDKFYFDDVYSLDFNIYLVYESKELLNKYGISYNKEDENEITLTFCYATENGCPLKWDEETLEDVLGWLITDNYKEFISEDDEDIVFFLKGESYEKSDVKSPRCRLQGSGTLSFLPGQADGVSAESIALPLPLTGPRCLPLATPHRHPRVKCGCHHCPSFAVHCLCDPEQNT